MTSPERFRGLYSSRLIALSTLALVAASANGDVKRYTGVTYRGQNLSVWADNDGRGILDSVLIGPSIPGFRTTFGGFFEIVVPPINLYFYTIPGYSLGKTGVQNSFGGNFSMGIRAFPSYEGGSFDFDYGAVVELTQRGAEFPTAGQSVTIDAKLMASGSSKIVTTTPKFKSAFRSELSVDAYANSEAWIVGKRLYSGNVFSPVAIHQAKNLYDVDFSESYTMDSFMKQFNASLGVFNPAPVGVELSVPKIEATKTTVLSDGRTLSATAFGKFLSLEGDLRDIVLMAIPPPFKEAAEATLRGEVHPTGTNYVFKYDIAKAAANLDVGFYGSYKLSPRAGYAVELVVTNAATGAKINTGRGSVTFTMPVEGVKVTPTISNLTLDFSNTLGLGTGGGVGFYPLSSSLKGTLSAFNPNDRPVDMELNGRAFEWQGDPTGTTRLKSANIALPQKDETLSSIGIVANNLTDLPKSVRARASTMLNDSIDRIDALAYDADRDTEDRPRLRVSIRPSDAGHHFFLNNTDRLAGSLRLAGSSKSTSLNLDWYDADPEAIVFDMDSAALVPGTHTVEIWIETRNASNQVRKQRYVLPFQVNPKSPLLNTSFYTEPDREVNSETNRVPTGVGDVTLYASANDVLHDTDLVIDRKYAVKASGLTPGNGNGDWPGETTVGFTLPSSLVAELGGEKHVFELRTPGHGTDASGNPALPVYSALPASLYFMAPEPILNSISVNDSAVQRVMVGDSDRWIDVKGTGFTRSSTVTLAFREESLLLESSYASPTLIHAKVPASFLERSNAINLSTFLISVSTPRRNVPAVAALREATSGGTSVQRQFGLAHPNSAINSIGPDILIRGGGVHTVRITGDNLFRSVQGGARGTRFFLDGSLIDPVKYVYPAGTGMTAPYVDVPIAPSSTNAPQEIYSRTFADFGPSLSRTIYTQNGKPVLGSIVDLSDGKVRTTFRATGSSDYRVKLTGAPFYPETYFTLGGIALPIESFTDQSAVLSVPNGLLEAMSSPVVDLVADTPKPGGGTSNALKVLVVDDVPSNLKVEPGQFVYNRTSGTYKQIVKVTYVGNKAGGGNLAVKISALPGGVAVLDSDGLVDGVPSRKLSLALAPGKSTTFSLTFQRRGEASLRWKPIVKFLD